jgi:hypothetical protein
MQLGRSPENYQPSNLTFSHLPPWQGRRLPKRTKYEAMAARALTSLSAWMHEHGLSPGLAPDELLIVPGLVAPMPQTPASGTETATPGSTLTS